MQLKGYITAIKENSFAIPIYGDGDNYYTHVLLDDFRIKQFCVAEFEDTYFNKVYLSKKFEIGDIGACIFVGENDYLSYNVAINNVEEIINYLYDNTLNSEFLNVKREVLELYSILNIKQNSGKNLIMESSGNIKTLEVKNFQQFVEVEVNLDNHKRYSLNDYFKIENYLVEQNQKHKIKEEIFNKYIESSFSSTGLYSTNKEILHYLFIKYLDDNKNSIEEIISSTGVGREFTKYLNNHYDVNIHPLYSNIEQELKKRTQDRREKLKEFNYLFHRKATAIKEFGVTLANISTSEYKKEISNSPTKLSHFVVSFESRDFNLIEDKELNDSEKIKNTTNSQ